MRKMFLFIAAVMCWAMTAQAETWTSGACTVTLENGVMTVSGNGAMENYEFLDDIPWGAKNGVTTRLIIEEGVTSIGDNAFYDFGNISPVIVVPEGVTYIGSWAFGNCSKVTKAFLPSTVRIIDANAFYGCTSMEDVYCAANPEYLTWDDRDCDDFMPDEKTFCHIPVEYFSDYEARWHTVQTETNVNVRFAGNYQPQHFTHVWLSGACMVVMSEEGEMHVYGNGAMADYSDYSELPWESVYREIETLIIENGVTHIGNNSFYECDGITSVQLPKSLRTIGNYAFYYCDALKSIIFPEGLTTIGDYSFEYCTSLQWIYLPSTLEHLGEDPFHECPSTLQTYGAGPNTWLSGTCMLTLNEEGVMTVRGNGSMADYYQSYNSPWWDIRDQITSIVIEEGVSVIGDHVFHNSSNLTSVTIPESVTVIGEGAFSQCENLTSVTIPESVTVIRMYAFSHIGLTTITIPKSVTVIGDYAFLGSSTITCLATTVPVIGRSVFELNLGGVIVYVPAEALEAYRASWNHNLLPEQIQPIGGEGIEEIVESRESRVESRKILHEGNLYILRDGKIFNAQGARIK